MAQVKWVLLNLVVMLASCQAAVLSLEHRVVSRSLKEYGLTVSSEELFSLPVLLPTTKQTLHAVFDTGSQKLVLDCSRWDALRKNTEVPCESYPGACECVKDVCFTMTTFFSLKAPAVVRRGIFSLAPSGFSAYMTYLAYTPMEAGQLEEDGVAGFGAGSLSVPRQLKIKRFSFCFSLDPSSSQSSWFADGPDARFAEGTNPVTVPFEGDAYRIRLAGIQVGWTNLAVGHEKMILFDTGSQVTYLDSDYYETFLQMVKVQGKYDCDVYEDETELPIVSLDFRTGAKMVIPSDSYYHGCFPASVQKSSFEDLTVLGVDWLQNYQFLYDLERRTISYSAASCPASRPVLRG